MWVLINCTNGELCRFASTRADHSVGSGGTCDYRILGDRSIDDIHAMFHITSNGIDMYDMNSRFGTFLTRKDGHERRVKSNSANRLKMGDVVRFGGGDHWRVDRYESGSDASGSDASGSSDSAFDCFLKDNDKNLKKPAKPLYSDVVKGRQVAVRPEALSDYFKNNPIVRTSSSAKNNQGPATKNAPANSKADNVSSDESSAEATVPKKGGK